MQSFAGLLSLVLPIIAEETMSTIRHINLCTIPEHRSLGCEVSPPVGAVSQIAFETFKTCGADSPHGKHALWDKLSTDVQHTVRFEDTSGALVEVVYQDTLSVEFLAAILARVGPNIIS